MRSRAVRRSEIAASPGLRLDPEYYLDDDDERSRHEERYAVYAMREGELKMLTAAPRPGGIGEAIVALAEDARRAGEEPEVVAVLDRVERKWLTGWPW